uniref:Uncharacterized protein n=1 Tax=Strongyloides papillosus TaxID=174720 RepID=A0A0N5B532_STREA
MISIVEDVFDMPLIMKENESFGKDYQITTHNILHSFMENVPISSPLECIIGNEVVDDDGDIFFDAVEILDSLNDTSMKRNENFTRKCNDKSSSIFTDTDENINGNFLELNLDMSKFDYESNKFCYFSRKRNSNKVFLRQQKISKNSVVNSLDNYEEKESYIHFHILFHPILLISTKSNNTTTKYNKTTTYSIQPTEANFNIMMKLKSY